MTGFFCIVILFFVHLPDIINYIILGYEFSSKFSTLVFL